MRTGFPPKRNITPWIAYLVALSLTLAPGAFAADEPSPTGLWRTIDDRTGKPRGFVRIYKDNGRLFGKIESSLDPADAKERCEKCSGDRKDQPVIGLIILRAMERRGAEYAGGDILDPDTGAVYRCRLWVTDSGKRLVVRGFRGMSVLGRNQVWLREQ